MALVPNREEHETGVANLAPGLYSGSASTLEMTESDKRAAAKRSRGFKIGFRAPEPQRPQEKA
jgi:hypothetical protein